MSRRRGRLLFAGLLAALLAGCGNNPYPPGESAGSVRYIGLTTELKTLDPATAYAVNEGLVCDLAYPSYFRHHYLRRSPYALELNLGAAWPKRERVRYLDRSGPAPVIRTGERWTFRIKRGLHFQDDPCFPGGKGREVTAADFLLAFRRMADPRVGSPVSSFVEDKIVGFAEYTERLRRDRDAGRPTDYDAPVPGLQPEPGDPYTFHVLLNQPYPQLKWLMNQHFTAPIAREAVLRYGKELQRHMVGCGPYRVTEYTPKRRLVLDKNPARHVAHYPSDGAPGDREAGLLAPAGQPLPISDRIVFVFIREGITAWNLFQQGYLDHWMVTQENFSQVVSQQGLLSPAMERRGIHLHRAMLPSILYLAFNMEDPVVGGYSPERRKLRQAISLAVDSQTIIDLFNQGLGLPAEWAIPPEVFGYDPKFRNPYRRASVERAKSLLAEAGYPDGVEAKTGERLTLYYDSTATTAAGRQYVAFLQRSLAAVGVRLEARVWRDVMIRDRIEKGQFQLVRGGLYADYPDAEQFLMLLYGPNKRPGVNIAAYRNPEFDRLFVRVRSMDDSPERQRLIERMRAISVEDCPWVFLNHQEDMLLAYDWVTNLKRHGLSNDWTLYQGIDAPRRARLQRAWNRPDYAPAVIGAVVFGLLVLPAVATVRRRRGRRLRGGK